jgi:predicted dehydrogenase
MQRRLAIFTALVLTTATPAAEPIKVGIIGLDTSHVTAFTKELNDPQAKPDLAGFRVVAAYPLGSKDIPISVNRRPMFTDAVKKLGVEIVDSIDELLKRVDCVLLESNDGRPHAEQALPVFKAGKPVFIDKPVAGSLVDAVRIYDAAEYFKVPVFSSSSLRYVSGAQALRAGKAGPVLGADAYGSCELEPHHPDFFWYGIHGVETLYTVMGTGCQTVVRVHTKNEDIAVGTWEGGRIGTFRGIRAGKSGVGGTVFGEKAIEPITGSGGYRPLVVKITEFFRTRTPPVDAKETLELYAFMEAADESKRQGGKPVSLQAVMDKAVAAARQNPLR